MRYEVNGTRSLVSDLRARLIEKGTSLSAELDKSEFSRMYIHQALKVDTIGERTYNKLKYFVGSLNIDINLKDYFNEVVR